MRLEIEDFEDEFEVLLLRGTNWHVSFYQQRTKPETRMKTSSSKGKEHSVSYLKTWKRNCLYKGSNADIIYIKAI